jgi:hypothetical protein
MGTSHRPSMVPSTDLSGCYNVEPWTVPYTDRTERYFETLFQTFDRP